MSEKQTQQLPSGKSNNANDQQIFTDKEASKFLRISQVTLWRERKNGRISFRRLASRIIYTKQDLDNYLDKNKREAFAA